MQSPGHFMAITNRIMTTRNPLHIYLNASVITSNEFEEIKQWCKKNNCNYYLVGLIEFFDEKTKTAFLMRWA